MQFGMMQIYQFCFFAVAGWVNQRQNYALDYLKEENQILRSKIKTKRIRFTDRERKMLAVRAKRIGRKKLEEIAKYWFARYASGLVSETDCSQVDVQ